MQSPSRHGAETRRTRCAGAVRQRMLRDPHPQPRSLWGGCHAERSYRARGSGEPERARRTARRGPSVPAPVPWGRVSSGTFVHGEGAGSRNAPGGPHGADPQSQRRSPGGGCPAEHSCTARERVVGTRTSDRPADCARRRLRRQPRAPRSLARTSERCGMLPASEGEGLGGEGPARRCAGLGVRSKPASVAPS